MSEEKKALSQAAVDFNDRIAKLQEKIMTALADRNLSKVAYATGLHENTVRNIAKGRGGTPNVATLEKLINYLFG